MEISLLMIVAVICAYVIKGMCGFANTLIFRGGIIFNQFDLNLWYNEKREGDANDGR